MELKPIPYSFIENRLELTWPDVVWGFNRGWMTPSDVVEHAMICLAKDSAARSEGLALAGLTSKELFEVPFLLQKLMDESCLESTSASESKWLYLALAWLYQRRDQLADPLAGVEQIYADFGYPPEICQFVRYMPAEDGFTLPAHSQAESTARLYSRWKDFLENFEPSKPMARERP